MPFIALYIRSSILYAIHCLIGSQGNWQSTGVIHVCSELWVLDTGWVAEFWTYCSLSRTDHGNPYRSALQKSSLDEIKARTSISASFWDRQFRILPYSIMHQSIPPAPSTPPPPPPPGYCGAFACLVSPRGGAFANFALPRGRAFDNPGAIPKLLTHTRFPIRI